MGWFSQSPGRLDTVFDALKANVIEGALLPCEFELPQFEGGLQIDPDETNVVLISTEDGTRTILPNVSGPDACGDSQTWYFNGHRTRMAQSCVRPSAVW